ncbi:MAG: hypothetical protein IJM76_00610 [Lachnospiraceae bacterium]|nr:hypothetical protein [Lachnospiraceae bacterium]
MEHQCEAAYDSSYNHIQNDNPDSASEIKPMRHEPKEHASNAEGEADADPREQVVQLAFGKIYRSEEYGEYKRYTDWQRHAPQKDYYSAHIASYELLCQLFLGSIKIGLSRESLDL